MGKKKSDLRQNMDKLVQFQVRIFWEGPGFYQYQVVYGTGCDAVIKKVDPRTLGGDIIDELRGKIVKTYEGILKHYQFLNNDPYVVTRFEWDEERQLWL